MIRYTLDQRCARKLCEEQSFSLFKYRGMFCLMQRGFSMSLNGYVGIASGHPLYGKNGDDLEVHGGITFDGPYAPGLYNNALGDLWWFGFDTSHYRDLAPVQFTIDGREYIDKIATYKDFNYVRSEVIKLADQLAAFLPAKPLIDVEPFMKRLDIAEKVLGLHIYHMSAEEIT